ncbi:MAG TPA: trypsin-like peptidase domain-containing protein [Acidimicrobiia bacterium]|nr:trypsin-like peptidase domain-containing protein [Acidimicrobiia bacterium]
MNSSSLPSPDQDDTEAPSSAPAPSAARPAWSFLRLVGAFVLALALVGGGAGLGWMLAGDTPSPTSAPTTTLAASVTAPAPTIEPGEEPVADVAAALLPSMVQIDTTFGLGSGFVYKPGLILTAAHVVEGEQTVQVRYADGQLEAGNVLGSNAANDVAVIQVERTDVTPAPLALGEELRVGQVAIAIGSPWGLEQTVTSGIISAVARPVRSGSGAQLLHQTDASINPGNSGGALADREGRVIGINIQIFTTTGSNAGIGFAVPIDLAYQLAEQIVSGTPIETAFLGVTGEDATGDRAGARITSVEPGGPAEAAGLVEGDVVVAVDAQPVQSITDLVGRIRSYLPGETVILDVLRNGDMITLEATLDVRTEG